MCTHRVLRQSAGRKETNYKQGRWRSLDAALTLGWGFGGGQLRISDYESIQGRCSGSASTLCNDDVGMGGTGVQPTWTCRLANTWRSDGSGSCCSSEMLGGLWPVESFGPLAS